MWLFIETLRDFSNYVMLSGGLLVFILSLVWSAIEENMKEKMKEKVKDEYETVMQIAAFVGAAFVMLVVYNIHRYCRMHRAELLFDQFDKDGNGKMNQDEFLKFMEEAVDRDDAYIWTMDMGLSQGQHPSRKQNKNLFLAISSDGHFISKEQWISFYKENEDRRNKEKAAEEARTKQAVYVATLLKELDDIHHEDKVETQKLVAQKTEQIFEEFDVDNNGVLEGYEYAICIEALFAHMKEEHLREVKKLIEKTCKDPEERTRKYEERSEKLSVNAMRWWIQKKVDPNSDGKITKEEAMKGFKMLVDFIEDR